MATEGRLEAVLWDMDGVIADTADFHYMAWKEVIQEKALVLTQSFLGIALVAITNS